MDAAGVQPGADLPQERLEALRDLAETTVTRDLVEGRIRGVKAMTVAGIARRHLAKAQEVTTDRRVSAVAAEETFFDWLEDVAARRTQDGRRHRRQDRRDQGHRPRPASTASESRSRPLRVSALRASRRHPRLVLATHRGRSRRHRVHLRIPARLRSGVVR